MRSPGLGGSGHTLPAPSCRFLLPLIKVQRLRLGDTWSPNSCCWVSAQQFSLRAPHPDYQLCRDHSSSVPILRHKDFQATSVPSTCAVRSLSPLMAADRIPPQAVHPGPMHPSAHWLREGARDKPQTNLPLHEFGLLGGSGTFWGRKAADKLK